MNDSQAPIEPVKRSINSLTAFCKAIGATNPEVVGSATQTWLDPAILEEDPRSKMRIYESPKVQAHIASLVEAWMDNDHIPMVEVQIVDGRCYIRKGVCRIRAAMIARERGAMIKRVEVYEARGLTSPIVRALTADQRLPLTQIERAHGYQKLVDEGWTTEAIGKAIKLSGAHVRESLRLLRLPESIQQLIDQGVIKAHTALDVARAHPSDAEKLILEAYHNQVALLAKEAVADGGIAGNGQEPGTPAPNRPVRLTERDIGRPTRRIGKRFVSQMASTITGFSERLRATAVPNVAQGTVAVEIPQADYEAFLKLSDEAAAHIAKVEEKVEIGVGHQIDARAAAPSATRH